MEQKTRWFRYCTEDAKAAQAELDQLADQGWELVELGFSPLSSATRMIPVAAG